MAKIKEFKAETHDRQVRMKKTSWEAIYRAADVEGFGSANKWLENLVLAHIKKKGY